MRIKAKHFLESSLGPLTLGMAIRSIRMADEINQTNFAKQLNVSTQYLCDLEHDRKTVSPLKAKKFADSLGYSAEQFIALAIQDSLRHAGFEMQVHIKAA